MICFVNTNSEKEGGSPATGVADEGGEGRSVPYISYADVLCAAVVVGIVALAALMYWLGGREGERNARTQMMQDAVKAGAATYVPNREHGDPEFKWVAPKKEGKQP